MTGTQKEVEYHIKIEKIQNPNYQNPTQTLPDPPPPLCENKACNEKNCKNCQQLETWWQKFRKITNDLIFESNVHDRPGCINKYGNCKARFPRNLFTQTEVDPKTGALNVKKGEPWINTLTPLVTYLLKCNSDITSLLSGTAIKAIVAYISDYVTKPGLKIYSIFDAGGSMASLYLLENPNHYTSHEFIPVYWKNYVREVLKYWRSEKNLEEILPEKEHLLYNTHQVQFDDRRNNIVPNFVGESLPKCDREDREYYCATILILFKPWRSGKNLKNQNYSWDKSFNLYEFNDQQKQYMKNFNIRYECNDARDDYFAQFKKGNSEGGLFPQWMNSDIFNSLDKDNHLERADFGNIEPDAL